MVRTIRSVLVATAAAVLVWSAADAAVTRLKDINPSQQSSYWSDSNPEVFASVNGRLLVAADTRSWRSLWTTDGTPQGTRLLREVHTGSVTTTMKGATTHGGYAYFCDMLALYRSDGTPEGTIKLRDLPSIPSPLGSWACEFAPAGTSVLVFRTLESKTVLISDGTVAGTQPLLDLIFPAGYPFYANEVSSISEVTAVGGEVYFVGRGVQAPRTLWKTDGTQSGTTVVRELSAAGFPDQLIDLGGTLFFRGNASASSSVKAIWMSDGTSTGTGPANLGITGSVDWITAAAARLLIATSDGKLWSSDGTLAGTQLLAQFGTTLGAYSVAGSNLYFVASTASHGTELWKSDGTVSGTVRVTNQSGSSFPVIRMVPFGARVLMLVSGTGLIKDQVMVSDGTAAGTSVISPATVQAWALTPWTLGSKAFFVGKDSATGIELYVTNGTAAGTSLLKDIKGAAQPGSSDPTNPTALNGTVYFSASDPTHGRELWETDGTAAGTIVHDLYPGATSSNAGVGPGRIAVAGSKLYFPGTKQGLGVGLYEWDGSAQPTFYNQSAGVAFAAGGPEYLMPLGSRLIFASPTTASTPRLFAAGDGLVEPVLLVDGYPGQTPIGWASANSGSTLYVVVGYGVQRGLWKIDGTIAGSVRLLDTTTTGTPTSLGYPTWTGSKLLFTGYTTANGGELYVSDGTTPGATLLDVTPGINSTSPSDLAVLNGEVLFAGNGPDGRELWKTDGTVAGTQQVANIHPTESSNPKHLVRVGNRILFFAHDGVNGAELWTTDGTAANTHLVKDLAPGLDDFHLEWVQELQGQLFFAGSDMLHGVELWRSDGTITGTYRMTDVSMGPGSSMPGRPAVIGGNLILSATNSDSELEPWVVSLTPNAATPTAVGASVSVEMGVSLTIPLNATDGDGDPLTFQVANGPLHGSLTGTNPVVYTPAPGYVGEDSFTFRAHDGLSFSNVATVAVRVAPPAPSVTEPLLNADVGGPAVTVTGNGLPAAQIAVESSTGVSVAAVASASGAYSAVINLAYGPQSISVTQTASQVTSDVRGVTFTVVDKTPPVLSGVSVGLVVEATTAAGAAVTFAAPTAVDDKDGPVPVTCTPASGSQLALGQTQVICAATDAAGNSASATFAVSVRDTTPPSFVQVPDALRAEAPRTTGTAIVEWTGPLATDVVDGDLPVVCSPGSGSTFSPGSTQVTCTATDARSNSAQVTFEVVVTLGSAGGGAGTDGGSTRDDAPPPSGCGCSAAAGGSGLAWLTFGALALIRRGKRGRAPGHTRRPG